MIWKYGRRFLLSALDPFGYLLIPKWYVKTWTQLLLMRTLFSEGNIDCVVDVGANRGQFRDFLRNELGYKGLILSFEPIHHLAELCKTYASNDPAWDIFEIALGNKNDCMSINIAKYDDLSSFLTSHPDNPFPVETTFVRTETVKITTLDSLFPDLQKKYGFTNPFLKIDTQGFDLSVIQGAKTTLASVCALQTELSVVPLYNAMPTWTTVINDLRESGFEISGLFEISRDKNFRVVEFDGVFVKNLGRRS